MQLTVDSSLQMQDTPQTLRRVAMRYWRFLVVIVFSLLMLGGTIALTDSAAVKQVFSCVSGESMLVYPLYDRRGNIIDTRSICGAPHRGCTGRSERSKVFDCSPLMAPKDLWAAGGMLYN